VSEAGRRGAWTEERSDEGRRHIGAPRAANQVTQTVSEAGRRGAWTEERSDEGRRHIGAPRAANQVTQ